MSLPDSAGAPDVVRHVVVALGRPKRSRRLADALREIGFIVEVRGSMSLDPDAVIAAIVPGEPTIAVLGDVGPRWLATVTSLVSARPTARPILIIEKLHSDEAIAALRSGVAGMCCPDASIGAIGRTVEAVAVDGVAVPRALVAPLVEELRHGRGHSLSTPRGPVEITDREWDIAQMLMQRRSTREMAAVLYVSVGTVRSHVLGLVRKLGVANRHEAIELIEGHFDR